MKYIIGIIVVTLLSCSTKSSNTKSDSQWITYQDTIETGFILTFKYPTNIVLADIIDNCRCVGEKVKNKGADSTNTRQWCICMQDSIDYSIDYLISSWKSLYNDQVTEKRDTITIGNSKTLQIIFKSKTKIDSYRQLIYLNKYSTLFEIMNTNEATEKDFETFCKSIRIEEYRNMGK